VPPPHWVGFLSRSELSDDVELESFSCFVFTFLVARRWQGLCSSQNLSDQLLKCDRAQDGISVQ